MSSTPLRTPRGLSRPYWAQYNYHLEKKGEYDLACLIARRIYRGSRRELDRLSDAPLKCSSDSEEASRVLVRVSLCNLARYCVDGESTCPRGSMHCTPDSARHRHRHLATRTSITSQGSTPLLQMRLLVILFPLCYFATVSL